MGLNKTNFVNEETRSTYREEIHKWNKEHRWARFGNDLLLGYLADSPINQQEWEFLPDNLSQDFATEARTDTSQIALDKEQPIKNRGYIALVDTTFYVIAPQATVSKSELITPRMVFLCFAVAISMLCGLELYRKKNFWWLDTILLTLTGLPGIILLAMVFSQHPTVQINFQILILNPLNLIFVWSVTKKLRKDKMHWYYNVWGGLLILAFFLQIWQDYAEGMQILALSLLVRYATRSILFDLKKYIFKNK